MKLINWGHNYTIQDYNDGFTEGEAVCKSWRIGGIRSSCLVDGRVMFKDVILRRMKMHARLSEESSEKAIDSFPRRYVLGTLASTTTPCALHGDTTNLHTHIIEKEFF
jgi:hypothetical protein